MIILGIETSCDETAAAIVNDAGEVLSNQVYSQIAAHEEHGGVVPEIAAREHLTHMDGLIRTAMDEAGVTFDDLNGVAATSGPGLIGGVMVGMMTGKTIAAAHNLPFMAVNHLEGHALSPRLTANLDERPRFPFLLLLVSGGHSAIVHVRDVGDYHTIGTTLDDALGELFDKSGKMMGLPYPAGPYVEQMANIYKEELIGQGDGADRFSLPHPMRGRPNCDFSFSGLKTAVKNHIDQMPAGPLRRDDVSALCYALQESIAIVVADRVRRAMDNMIDIYGADCQIPLVVAGGVAANKRIRQALEDLAGDYGSRFFAPPLKYCSDNAAMIAWAGIENMRQYGPRFDYDAPARPRWPLDDLAKSWQGR